MKLIADNYFSLKPILLRLKQMSEIPLYDELYVNSTNEFNRVLPYQRSFIGAFSGMKEIKIHEFKKGWTPFIV